MLDIDKIALNQGDLVAFNIDGKIKGTGRICGKTTEGIIDTWIVKLLDSTIDKETYPYSHIGVPP